MIQKAKTKLKEKKGDSTFIDLAILVIVCMLLFALTFSVLGIFSINNRLNLIASNLTRTIEIKGQVNSFTYAEFERLKDTANLPEARVEISHSGKIPLEQEFTVTVYVPYTYGVGSIKLVTREFKMAYSGRSEVYWK